MWPALRPQIRSWSFVSLIKRAAASTDSLLVVCGWVLRPQIRSWSYVSPVSAASTDSLLVACGWALRLQIRSRTFVSLISLPPRPQIRSWSYVVGTTSADSLSVVCVAYQMIMIVVNKFVHERFVKINLCMKFQ
jgi:hypothetical protein